MSEYIITLKDTKTNVVKSILYECKENWDIINFVWTEGSHSCDCNRFCYFYRDTEDIDKIDPIEGCFGNDRFDLISIRKENEIFIATESILNIKDLKRLLG